MNVPTSPQKTHEHLLTSEGFVPVTGGPHGGED